MAEEKNNVLLEVKDLKKWFPIKGLCQSGGRRQLYP